MMYDPLSDPHWLTKTLDGLRSVGFAVVVNVLDPSFVRETRAALYRARDRIVGDLGTARLERAGELGVLRLMMKYEPFFFRLLTVPELLQVVDATVSPTAVLHLQNGFILPPLPAADTPVVFQNTFHMDFPRVL